MTEDKLISADNLKKAFRTDEGAKAVNHSIRNLLYVDKVIDQQPAVEAKPVVHAQWQKQWCDSSMIGHMYEECPICGCMILDTEKFWDCKFCPNCGTEMIGD